MHYVLYGGSCSYISVKNISHDDLGGIISPACNPDALVTENEFYMRREVPLIRESMQDGTVTLKIINYNNQGGRKVR